jgi:hypothetical protein
MMLKIFPGSFHSPVYDEVYFTITHDKWTKASGKEVRGSREGAGSSSAEVEN